MPSVVDILRAAHRFASDRALPLDGTTYLTGYSEGGYASLGAQKAIEEEFPEIALTGVAPMSGPYDLLATARSAFASADYPRPAYAAYLLTAYDRFYEWDRLDEMVGAWAPVLPGLFDGSHTWAEIEATLPDDLGQLIEAGFMAAVNNGAEVEFIEALEENTLLDWRPTTPIHFIHGEADRIVPYQNALTAESALKGNGAAAIQVTAIPGANHETAGPQAVMTAIQWFESLRAVAGRR